MKFVGFWWTSIYFCEFSKFFEFLLNSQYFTWIFFFSLEFFLFSSKSKNLFFEVFAFWNFSSSQNLFDNFLWNFFMNFERVWSILLFYVIFLFQAAFKHTKKVVKNLLKKRLLDNSKFPGTSVKRFKGALFWINLSRLTN